jgi:hypothetical protein
MCDRKRRLAEPDERQAIIVVDSGQVPILSHVLTTA